MYVEFLFYLELSFLWRFQLFSFFLSQHYWLKCFEKTKCLLTASLTFWPFSFSKAPFTGQPSLSEISDFIGYKPTDFKCEGSPGYPDGKMEFQIQLQNETDFRSFEFPNASVIDKDRNCVRKQIISVTYALTEEWNEAKIRCKYKHSKDFDETPVFVLSRKCF